MQETQLRNFTIKRNRYRTKMKYEASKLTARRQIFHNLRIGIDKQKQVRTSEHGVRQSDTTQRDKADRD